jgi:hypothetical protein
MMPRKTSEAPGQSVFLSVLFLIPEAGLIAHRGLTKRIPQNYFHQFTPISGYASCKLHAALEQALPQALTLSKRFRRTLAKYEITHGLCPLENHI